MDATLNLINNTLAYGDANSTSNPAKRYLDWSYSRRYSVKNPKAELFPVEPGATLSLFSGVRTTTIDGTTLFLLTLSPLSGTRYRFTATSGTAPGLRTDRVLALNGRTVTMTANANLTMSMSAQAGDFTATQIGDTIFIPGISTGDPAPGPFNPLNVGSWTVLAKNGSSSQLELSRPSGTGFIGYSEAVAVTANSQVLGFSTAGVQVGDSVTVSAGFPVVVQMTYQVVAVTSTWFEVISTVPLPLSVSATPGAAGIQFYSGAKRFIRFEADQECAIRLNGDTGSTNRMSPWVAGDPENTATFEKVGPCWSASVVNLSNSTLNLLFISVE